MRAKALLVVVVCFLSCSLVFARTPGTSNLSEPVWDGQFRDLHVPILMYHYVSDLPAKADATRRDLTVTPSEFQAHIAYLAQQGYHTISLYQLDNALLIGAPLPAKPIVLTFDDGYRDDYLNVYPVLRQVGFTGTFFIITGVVDAQNPDYLSWDQIRAMSNSGMDMEPHTVNHVNLRGQSHDFITQQVQGSINDLAGHTGITPHIFAYPDGSYDNNVLAVMRANSIWLAVTTEHGTWETVNGRLALPRLRMGPRVGVTGLANLLGAN
ncbi:MAG TPA: polysaccharide deacetylase family protein [Phototrophicaceae bacterium]|nr:polysaccharide deacetylase family protein [Phototrophicaceae bacterium]